MQRWIKRIEALNARALTPEEYQAGLNRIVADMKLADQARKDGTRCPECGNTVCDPEDPRHD